MSEQVAKQLGYLARADVEHTKDIDDLYRLLKNHMDNEEADRKEIRDKFVSIDRKLLVVGVLILAAGAKDLPWEKIVAILM